MIRKQTIQNAINKIAELDQQAIDLEAASESEFGFVTQKTEKQTAKLRERSEKEFDKIVSRLHGEGLCSEDGVTPTEAYNECFDGIDDVFVIGDGSWC